MRLGGGKHGTGGRRTGRSRFGTSRFGTSGLGTAGLALLGLAVAAGLGARAVQLVTAAHDTGLRTRVDALVELVVVGGGAALAAWLGLSAVMASLCLGARAAGHVWRGGERLVARAAPPVVRRTLSVTIAAGIGLGSALGAQAAPPPAAAVGVVVVQHEAGDLGWPVTDPDAPPSAPTSEPTTAPGSSPTAQTEPAPAVITPAATTSTGAGAARQVVVQPGDTLWGIARRHLPEGASQAQVAAAWPAWYEANRETVGPDPDLIRPGQVLLVPVEQS